MFNFKKNSETESKGIIIPVLPLRDVVVFPYMIVPLFVGRERSVSALESAMKMDKGIFIAAQKNAQKDDPSEDDIYRIGTIGIIIQLLRLPDGTVKVLVEGKKRAKIREYVPNADFYLVNIEEIDEPNSDVTAQTEALMRSVKEAFENYAKLSKKVPPELVSTISATNEPGKLSDTIASHLSIKMEDKQKILEISDVAERLEKIYSLMLSEIEILEVEERIKRRVKKQMEKTQKDYYLNEQMRAIQKEMGEKDDLKGEIDELEKEAQGEKAL